MLCIKNAEGGAFSNTILAQRFDLSPAVLRRLRSEHRIIYWRDANRSFVYPRWQFGEAGVVLLEIQQVLQIFQSDDEWRVMRYFLMPRQQLAGRRPLDLLRAGELRVVLAHAKCHAKENTW